MKGELNAQTPDQLKQQWDALREQQPSLRIRDAAATLQVSEAELLATGCGDHVTRLDADASVLLSEVTLLGAVLALTRNDHAVHEKTGHYRTIQLSGETCRIQGENIDLLLNLRHWHSAFAVTEQSRHGARDSLQFFDRQGNAAHKVYMTANSDLSNYRSLVANYRSGNQDRQQTVESNRQDERSQTDANDIGTQDRNWLEHLFEFGALPYRSGDIIQTNSLPLSVFRPCMHKVAESGVPLSLIVWNHAALQIHSGTIDKLVVTGPWFNILDDGFNWHLREDAVAALRLVEYSTGEVSAKTMTLFDAYGRIVATIGAENSVWSEYLATGVDNLNEI